MKCDIPFESGEPGEFNALLRIALALAYLVLSASPDLRSRRRVYIHAPKCQRKSYKRVIVGKVKNTNKRKVTSQLSDISSKYPLLRFTWTFTYHHTHRLSLSSYRTPRQWSSWNDVFCALHKPNQLLLNPPLYRSLFCTSETPRSV